MKINSNISALLSSNVLTTNEGLLADSSERLSSGYKINHAKDNPAGLAISYKMNAQIRGLKRASANAANGVSVIESAEGALTEIQSMIQRINELAVKAANGTNVTADKKAIQSEVKQLCEEIERVAKDTEFNTQNLLGGEQDLKGYTNNDAVKVSGYSKTVPVDIYGLNVGVNADGTVTASFTNPSDFSATARIEIENNEITIKDRNEFEIRLAVDNSTAMAETAVNLDITGIGGMRLQIGSNEGQILTVVIPKISLENMGLNDLDCSTIEGARNALDRISGGLEFISQIRSELGASENRLEHTISSLDITGENMTGAYSRIMDTDMADEMVEYTKLQVLTQAGTSMLAQANERPQSALQLLQ
ncbi:MAG: flagellin FliC3 [Clostridia bacterium]|nr:flagellin FliC3 [Clostridia bacterium]